MMRALLLLVALVAGPVLADPACTASCRSDNTSCQQKCGENERAECRATCVRQFFDCRCGCGDASYCALESDPAPGCKLVAEATVVTGRMPASTWMRTSSATFSGTTTPKSRRRMVKAAWPKAKPRA